MSSRRTPLLLLGFLVVAAVAPARAQVSPPALLDEGEEPSAEARPEPRAQRGRHAAAVDTGAAPLPPAGVIGATAGHALAQPSAPPRPSYDLPQPPPSPGELAREIVPVQASWSKLMAAWTEFRSALREQDPARAAAAQRALLDAKKDLAIENLGTLAAAEVRDAFRSLRANLPAEALAHAELAAQLAPDFADGHLAVARARLAKDPGQPGAILAPLGDALAAAIREPHTFRALLGDVLSALFAAVFAASAATLLLLLARRLRLFLHDFHHLPLLRGSAPIQAGFLGLVLLAMPAALGLGLFAVLAFTALAAWLYLDTSERVVVTVALVSTLALPALGGLAVRATAWTGTLAETIHETEHGALSDEVAAELATRARAGATPAPLLAALGRHYKRRGDLDRALDLYRAAQGADGGAPELEVNVANVLFLKGDLEGAKAAYLSATDRSGGDLTTLAAAHFGLSKLYVRASDLERGNAAREKALKEDGDFIRRHAPADVFNANQYLVDVPVPEAKIQPLAVDGGGDAVAEWLRARLGGALPRALWPWVPLSWVGLLWGLALLASRLAPSRVCDRCGRPACGRCDSAHGGLCGQCVNVYSRKGVVDARDRLRKEAQVRRHAQVLRVATRVLAVVGGGAGHVFDGATVRGSLFLLALLFVGFAIWFWRGVMPPPHPSAYVLAGKIALAAPAGLALYVIAVRDAFRRTGR